MYPEIEEFKRLIYAHMVRRTTPILDCLARLIYAVGRWLSYGGMEETDE